MDLATAARRYVGVPYRARGFDRRFGLDCAGLVLVAWEDCSGRNCAGLDRKLAWHDNAQILAATLGFSAAGRPDLASTLLLLRSKSSGRHLAIVTQHGWVHAHAGVGRVIEGPLERGWQIEGQWRFEGRHDQ